MTATSYTNDQYFGSGRPWVDPRATQFAGGAIGDGIANDSNAFSAAMSYLNSIGGGIMFVPPGHYNLRGGGLDVSSTYSGVIGCGENTILDCGGANVTPLKLSGFRTFARDLAVVGPGLNATVPAVRIASGAEEAELRKIDATGGYNVLLTEPGECEVHSCKLYNAYGNAIWCARGTTYGVRNQLDQSLPNLPNQPETPFPAPGVQPSTWAPGVSYGVGSVVFAPNQPYILGAVTTGTSGSQSPTVQPYGSFSSDGGVTWGLVAPVTYYGILFDGNAGPNYISDTDITGYYWASIALRNLVGSPAVDPHETFINNTVCAQAWVAGIWANEGAGLFVQGGQIINNGEHGVLTQGNWKGDDSLSGVLMYHNKYGATFTAGNNHMVENCQIYGASQSAVYANNVAGLIVNGNNLGTSVNWGTNANPVLLQGTCDDYIITNNKLRGSTGGVINDQSNGPHKVVTPNL